MIAKSGNSECKVNTIPNMSKSLIYKKMLTVHDHLTKLNGKLTSDLNASRPHDTTAEKCLQLTKSDTGTNLTLWTQ